MGQKPLPSDNGQTIKCKVHGLAHAHESIDCTDFGQYMGRVSSLTLMDLEPALLFEHDQHGIQQHLSCFPFD